MTTTTAPHTDNLAIEYAEQDIEALRRKIEAGQATLEMLYIELACIARNLYEARTNPAPYDPFA